MPSFLLQQYKSSYNSESKKFSDKIEKPYNKTVIDFNFGRHKNLSIFKNDILNIHRALAAQVNTFFELKIVNVFLPVSFMGPQKNCLIATVRLSNHNICFG